MGNEENGLKVWNNVLSAIMTIPGVRVDRPDYLKRALSKYLSDEQIQAAIESTPLKAGLSKEQIDRIANATINYHLGIASVISFLDGIPGAWAMAATIPADIAQFYFHALQIAQKLAYLYGWREFGERMDDETRLVLTCLIGAMHGVVGANESIRLIAQKLAREAATRLPRQALTKYAIYNLAKQCAKWLGVALTKQTFARGVSKVIPILGGFMSGGVTFFTLKPMCNRLKEALERHPIDC